MKVFLLSSLLFVVGCGNASNPSLESPGLPAQPVSPPVAPTGVAKTGIIQCTCSVSPGNSILVYRAALGDGTSSAQASFTTDGFTWHASNSYTGGTGSDAASNAVWLGSPIAWDPNVLIPGSSAYDPSRADTYPTGQAQSSQWVVGVDPKTLILSISGDGVPTQGFPTACHWE